MRNNHNWTPSQLLREALKAKGGSVSRFAFDLGISITQASRILNGWITPRSPQLREKISYYLGLPPELAFPSTTAAPEATRADERQAA